MNKKNNIEFLFNYCANALKHLFITQHQNRASTFATGVFPFVQDLKILFAIRKKTAQEEDKLAGPRHRNRNNDNDVTVYCVASPTKLFWQQQSKG